jgi:hypothetical protein
MKDLPALFSVLNYAKIPAKKLGAFNPKWNKEYFMKKAIKKSGGLNDWGNHEFFKGLDALLKSIKELPATHFIGEITLHRLILNSLINRLRFIDILNKDTSNNLKLNPPIIITGLSRSGTTFMQRLTAFDDRNYAFPLWELLDPYKNSKGSDSRRRKSTIDIFLKNILLPELDKKHYTRADTKEECLLLLANSFHSQLFTDIAPLASYLDWCINTSRDYAYKEYREQLKILQSYHPEKRFVLKAPNHLGSLEELQKYIPEATFIQTHRNPDECINSLSSLRQTLFKMVEGEIDNNEIQRQVMQSFDCETKRNLEFHKKNPNKVISVSYKELTSNPLTTLKEIYAKMDYEWTDNLDTRIKQYIKENQQNKRGKHKYKAELSEKSIPENIKNYAKYFEDFL